MTDVKSILKKVTKLEIMTARPVEGLVTGGYRSVFKGRGIEFSEVREYMPGDDIRAIDWNVTARLNTPFVKEFIEERDLFVYIVFDVSGSSRLGSARSKREVGFELAASIMFAALKNNDNVGLCLFSDSVERFIRPRKGRRFILRLIREMIYHEPQSRKTDLKAALTYLTKVVRKRSIIFVVSDFLSGEFEEPLRFLKKRHDIILITISDRVEEELPDVGYIFLEDEETGEQILFDTGNPELRRAYSRYVKEQRKRFIKSMHRLGVDVIRVRTDEAFHVPLRRFFSLRKKRMVR